MHKLVFNTLISHYAIPHYVKTQYVYNIYIYNLLCNFTLYLLNMKNDLQRMKFLFIFCPNPLIIIPLPCSLALVARVLLKTLTLHAALD